MKTRVIISTLPEALCHMKESFHAIEDFWEKNSTVAEILDSSFDVYPFDEDYDEMIRKIDIWIDDIYSKIEMKNASVEMLNMLTKHEVDEKYYLSALEGLVNILNNKHNLNLMVKEKN